VGDLPFQKRVRVITREGVMEGKLSGFSNQHLLVTVGGRIRMVPYEEILAADLLSSQTPAGEAFREMDG
jgi:hypothetical protein